MDAKTPIRSARIKAEIGLIELAKQVGISRQHMRRLELGQQTPRVDLAHRIAKALGMSTEELWPTQKKAS